MVGLEHCSPQYTIDANHSGQKVCFRNFMDSVKVLKCKDMLNEVSQIEQIKTKQAENWLITS